MATISKGTPTNFELAIPRLPSMTSLQEVDKLTLHLHEAVLPSMQVEMIPRYWQGVKVDEQAGHDITYDDWNISFTVDANLENWLALYEWLNYITTALADQNEHINPVDHTVDCSLIATDNFKNQVFNAQFKGVWIQTLGEIRFANRDGEMVLESTAILKYGYYSVTRL